MPVVKGLPTFSSTGSRKPSLALKERVLQPNELDAAMEKLKAILRTVDEDARLANVDLQEALQEQQRTLQMLSNMSKTLNDTGMAVVRKIGQ